MKKRRSLRPEPGTASQPPPSVPPSTDDVSSSAPPSVSGVPIVAPVPAPVLADDDSLAPALRAALSAPSDDAAWSMLEDLASTQQRPEVVADAYLHVLSGPVDGALANALGQRAVRLHDEWFEGPERLVQVLDRVLAHDASAEWAFERLVLALTVAARWDDLLSAYDRVLAVTDDKSRRAQLLDEAAHVAKDFAGAGDRAIEYLRQLLPLRPSDAQLATSLERLLERQGRYRDLIELWNARLAVLSRDGRLATRARTAACWLDKLHRPDEALAVCETLLAEDPHDTAGSRILERIATLDAADATVRRRALSLLKQRYATQKRTADVVRILEIALSAAEADERAPLHREIVDRLVELGRDDAAIEHAAALVQADPGGDEGRARLRELSQRSGKHQKRAEALGRAVELARDERVRVSLLIEAGEVRADLLADEAGAAELFARALASARASDEERLGVARRLEGLYEHLGRAAERLDVLDRLAALEEGEAKSAALARAASLAASLGDVDRALAAWETRLSSNATDAEAIDAVVDLLQRAERFPALANALRRRIQTTDDPSRRRADLVRIASLEERELGDVRAAIVSWRGIDEAFGPSAESVDALGRLLASEARWDELEEHLAAAAAAETEARRRAELLHRLGDVQRERLDALDRAAETYRAALASDPSHAGARAGLRAILERATDRAVLARCADTLAQAYRETDDWASLLEIVEHRVAAADDNATKAAVLVEAAKLHEERADAPVSALSAIARAFPLTPKDASLEVELVRLAGRTDAWPVAIDALGAAIAASADDDVRAATLRVQQGALLELRVNDLERALAAYLPVIAVFPESSEATEAVVRVAGQIGRWDDAARALVEFARAQQRIDGDVIDAFERVANERSAWDLATQAVEVAIERVRATLEGSVGRDLETLIALWHRDRRDDAARAERALARAVAHDPDDAETLRQLAVLQRRHPDAALLDTLLALARVTKDDLGVLYEAAQVALDVVSDRVRSADILDRILTAAAPRWSGSPHSLPTLPPTSGPVSQRAPEPTLSADTFASWALDRLVSLHVDAGEHEAAIGVLVRGAQLPFDEDSARELLHRAADLAASNLPDPARAIALYRQILDGAPSDPRALAALARLYEASGRLSELADLRRHELQLARDVDARLSLRLDLARVLGLSGDVDGQLETLRANLDERVGHDDTIAKAIEVLEASGRHAELAHLLTEQALQLEAASEAERAALLWARVAQLSEETLSDVPRALASWGRVVALRPTPEAYDALARLHAARRESAVAIEWLERRLAATPEGARAKTVERLAEEHLRGGDRARAIAVLDAGLAEEPGARALRERLVALHRETSSWGLVATLLRDGAAHEGDPARRIEWLRESATLHVNELGDAAAAIPLLSEAASLAEGLGSTPPTGAPAGTPRDRVRLLRVALADALRRAGRHDEALAMLNELVEWYGRRRPPERAQVHVQLSLLARARNDLPEALAQLELASSMDMGSAAILRDLGALARETGAYARAERAYRALLLIVRRPGGAQLDVAIGPSEVLFELHRIAAALGQEDRARENLESAFEAASQNEAEGKRFVQLLRETGNEAFLVRALQARVAAVNDPAQAAATLVELADVLDGLGRVEEALQARLDALAHVPDSIPLHAAVRDVARRAGKPERYEERLRELADRARAANELQDAASFLLRLGEVFEEDAGDLARAEAAYAEAEATGEQQTASLRALGRVARARNDRDAELRALRKLVQIDDQDAAQRTEALYRLAELDFAAGARDEAVEMLGWALDREPQLDRALAMLRTAQGDDDRIAALFERVARGGNDQAVLLEALERVARTATPTLDVLREAIDVATRLDEQARAEALLARTIDVARAADALDDATWALVALADRKRAAGDAQAAIALLREAADRTQGPEGFELDLQAAALAAGPAEALAVAGEIYERLLERDAGERRVWEPLLEVLRRLGDRARLEALIANTIDNVFDASERNVLRLERARLLLDAAGRENEAADALREILDDEPEQQGAARLLMDLYERTGRRDELIELVERQLDAARDRGNLGSVAVLSLRLGGILEAQDRQRALDVYRAASELVPEDRTLLQAQVRLLKPTDDPALRATTLERLLVLEHGDAAAAMALEVAGARQAMNDEEGVVRALEIGFREAPTNEKVRTRLEKALSQKGDSRRLAALFVADAETRRDKRSAVARFREAAKLHLEKLGDPAQAAEVLRKARELAPEDLALMSELAQARASAGELREALAEVDAALESGKHDGAARVTLLRLRADLRRMAADYVGAVEDLETALGIGGAAVAPDLVEALDRRRAAAAKARDVEGERTSTRRLVEVLSASDPARAHDVLVAWLQRDPKDRDALRTLAAIDEKREDWNGVVDAYARIVAVETGPAQAEAALKLADAAERAGRGEDARQALETALMASPADTVVRARLRQVYESLDAYSELAALTLVDAEHAPDDALKFDLLLAAGDLFLRSVGEESRAIAPLEEALRLKPFHHEATLLLADAYTVSGEIDKAVDLLTPAIDRHKGRRSREVAALNHRMARAANAGGGRDVELQWLAKALECDMQNGQVAAELAEVAIELRQFDVALKALKAVTLLRTPGPMSRALATLRQGQIAYQQGDPKRAILLAKKALADEPTLTEAEEFLRQLGA